MQVAHITRDSNITFSVKGQFAGGGGILWQPPTQLVCCRFDISNFLGNWKKLVFEIDNDVLSITLHLIPFLLSSRVCNYVQCCLGAETETASHRAWTENCI